METAAKIGIERKKEIFADSVLLKFSNLAAVKAIPILLTPGIRDKIWKKPIITADFKLKFFSIFLSDLDLSLIKSNNPKIIVVQVIILISLICSIIPVLAKKNPIIITGREDNIIFRKKILFFIKSLISSLK